MTGTNSISACLTASLVLTVFVRFVCSAPTSTLSSGEATEDEQPISRPIVESPEQLAKSIALETNNLYTELCKTPNLCGNSMERHLKKELKLPEITVSDGCLSLGFSKEKCLHKIYRDLLRFQTYLVFLKVSFKGKKQIVELIQLKTRTLAETVRRMEKTNNEEKEDSNTDISVDDLKTKDPWNEKVTTYIILQSFKDYMEKTTRAVRNSLNSSQ
ncbi:interleukin-6 [Mixophyes fleayi]|uniref:interleukin-6 n=1 Tax=Mixophyes fleayi TaxID=3061075 RepID=UPI003F4D8607